MAVGLTPLKAGFAWCGRFFGARPRLVQIARRLPCRPRHAGERSFSAHSCLVDVLSIVLIATVVFTVFTFFSHPRHACTFMTTGLIRSCWPRAILGRNGPCEEPRTSHFAPRLDHFALCTSHLIASLRLIGRMGQQFESSLDDDFEGILN
jgi:hypothetical protein